MRDSTERGDVKLATPGRSRETSRAEKQSRETFRGRGAFVVGKIQTNNIQRGCSRETKRGKIEAGRPIDRRRRHVHAGGLKTPNYRRHLHSRPSTSPTSRWTSLLCSGRARPRRNSAHTPSHIPVSLISSLPPYFCISSLPPYFCLQLFCNKHLS